MYIYIGFDVRNCKLQAIEGNCVANSNGTPECTDVGFVLVELWIFKRLGAELAPQVWRA